jgi:hypothetical protein
MSRLDDAERDTMHDFYYLRNFVHYVRYEPTTVPNVAKIVEFGTKALGFVREDLLNKEPVAAVDGHVDFSYYMQLDPLQAVKKVPSTATLDGLVLRNLAPGSIIHIDFSIYEVVGDTAELNFSTPGTYKMKVSSPTQEDQIFEVTL